MKNETLSDHQASINNNNSNRIGPNNARAANSLSLTLPGVAHHQQAGDSAVHRRRDQSPMREEEVPVASRERARSLMLGHFQCAMPSRGRSDTTAAHRMRIAHLLDEALRITSAYSFASDDSSGETFQLSDPLPRSKRHAKENQQ